MLLFVAFSQVLKPKTLLTINDGLALFWHNEKTLCRHFVTMFRFFVCLGNEKKRPASSTNPTTRVLYLGLAKNERSGNPEKNGWVSL